MADDQAGLQQSGLYRYVFGRFRQAFGDCAHAGANLQPRIPTLADEGFNLVLQHRIGFGRQAIGQQEQHVHIGVREQLGPAKAARSNQGDLAVKAAGLPQVAQAFVCQRRKTGECPVHPAGGCATHCNARNELSLAGAVLSAKRLGVQNRRWKSGRY